MTAVPLRDQSLIPADATGLPQIRFSHAVLPAAMGLMAWSLGLARSPLAPPVAPRPAPPMPLQPHASELGAPVITAPAGPPGTAVVAIGDVHGCASLLEQAIAPHLGTGVELLFLGDLVDRSPEPQGDRRVLERIWALQADPAASGLAAVTVLRGNHEQMLLDAIDEAALESGGPARAAWIRNGGDASLLPFAASHRDWFATLPHLAIRGEHLFVHAGVRPGIPLEQQISQDLIWIRQPFIKSADHGLPWIVVHGHTPASHGNLTRLPHRIGLDTAPWKTGRLIALRLEATAALR